MVRSQTLAALFLRGGVAFAFAYAALDALIEPTSWVDYIPQMFAQVLPPLMILKLFAVVEIIIALWILSGKKIVIPSLMAALILVVIVCLNPLEFQLLFRDLSIAAAALALAALPEARGQVYTKNI